MNRRRLVYGVAALVLAFTVARLVLAAMLELLPEEAYYWTYTQHPAWGYYDHPPMVAWVVRFGTWLFGKTELGVRLGTVLLSVGSSVLMYLIGRLWLGRESACWAVALFTLIPVYAATGLLVTPDGPLLFFWLLTLYAISKALHTQRPLYWTLAGLGFGGALLSKYSAVMLAPSVLVFLLLSPNYRYWLRRPGPWLALAIALLVFSPVVMWNAQHDWASLMYQSGRITERPRNLPWHVTVFWSVQAGILTPLAFALFVATAVRGVRLGWFAGEDKWNFAVAFSLPLFLVLVVASFRQSVHVNWSAPAYLSLVPAAAGLFVQAMSGQPPVKRRRWRVAVWVAGLTCITMIGFGMVSLIWGMPEALAYKHAGGWRDLASHVAAAQEKLATETGQQPFVLGVDKYPIAALMGFYTAHPEQCVNAFATGAHGSGYRYWTDLRKFEGRPAIAVTTDAQPVTLNVLRGQFEQVEPLRLLEVSAYGRPVRTVFLSTCYGYHGSHLNVAFPVAGKP